MNSIVPRKNPVAPALALAVSALLVAPAWADDFPKPIAPPKSSVLSPIAPPSGVAPSPAVPSSSNPALVTVPAPGALPGTIGLPGQTPTTPKPVDPAHRHIPPLIDQMLDGTLTPQRAYDEKLLSVDDLLWIFSDYIDPWGSFRWKFNVEVRRELVGLLVANGTEQLKEPEKLSPTFRLWLADYYRNEGDEKCVALCESILKEIKTPVKSDDPLAFQSVERLARYYVAQNKHEKAVQTWLLMSKFYTADGMWLPDSLIEAARLYVLASNPVKAKELYSKVPQYGHEYLSQLALQERINLAGVLGDWEEMRQMMKQPMAKTDGPGAKLTELSFVARSYYAAGKFKEARQYAEQALAFSKSLQTMRSWTL